ncbi:Predicted metal-dependent hydrolase, TIM-barrel fold [Cognatiyoonia koreensis]|uniref:Predicted metal-dependent hydrolase, TIM-barrel fold n=1 Tax=Cognatiyoonia koreensis TaxID=364200 RepID=A0A1I0NCT8_9RHOB|nr:amidohydrolase family protein [Cognatiyoonia koreensis]SEV99181.1 Predicted metal-dependent hydrolase, TIM-barrel fold [Cognatiyoonia koreensis]
MAKPAAPLPPRPAPVSERAPEGACDTHVHLLAGTDELALYAGRTQDPAQPYAAYLADYKAHLENLGVSRGVIVQSIFYGTDNTVTANAVRDMGEGFKGIGLVPDAATDADLDRFVDWNFKGVRLNYVHGGVLTWDGVKAMAPRLAERGLHIQMLMHADLHMEDLAADITALPVPVVFDHIGWPSDMSKGPAHHGFQALCNALSDGDAYVKLSGLYRLSDAPHTATDAYVRALVRANPERCLWGSDWPHIMLNGAQMPQGADLWHAFLRAVPHADTRHRILVQNPAELYEF